MRRTSFVGAAPIVIEPAVKTKEAKRMAGRLPNLLVSQPPMKEKTKARPTVIAVISATQVSESSEKDRL